MEKVKQVKENKVKQVKEIKQEKRANTWQDLVMAREKALTKDGQELEELSREKLELALQKDGQTMAVKWNFLTMGYHKKGPDGKILESKEKGYSNYSQQTGEKRSITLGKLEKNNNGFILSLSLGGHKNHFLLFFPNNPLEFTTITGKKEKISKKDWKKTFQLLTNHGRNYRIGDFLSFQYSLLFTNPGRGIYNTSTPTSINYHSKDGDGNWKVFTKKGNTRKAPHPWELLEKVEKYGTEYTKALINNQSLDKFTTT